MAKIQHFLKNIYARLNRIPKILALILLLGLLLRLWGIGYGLPALYNTDEVPVVNTAVSFGRGSLEPIFYAYPTAYMYVLFFFYVLYFGASFILGAIHTPEEFLIQYLVNPANFYLIARSLSALAGVLTILVTYLIAERMFNKKIGIISSAFLAVSVLHIEYSHYALPEATMVLFSMASLYFTAGILKSGASRNYLLSGLFAGIATSTKYTAGIMLLFALEAHYLRTKSIKSIVSKQIVLATLSAIGGFIIGSPYWLLSFDKFYRALVSHSEIMNLSQFSATISPKWVWVVEQLITKEHLLGLLAIVGVLYALAKRAKEDIILVSVFSFYFLYVGTFNRQSLHYLIVIFPVICILAARAIHALLEIGKYKIAGLAAFYLVFISGLFFAIGADQKFIQNDTRDEALEFIESNVPPRSNIAVVTYIYSPQFKTSDHIVELNKKFKKYNINITINEDIVNGPQYKMTNIVVTENSPIWPESWTEEEIEKYSKNELIEVTYKNRMRTIPEMRSLGVEYIVLSSYDFEPAIRYQIDRTNPLYAKDKELQEYYLFMLDKNNSDLKLIKLIDNDGLEGPEIRIYKLI